MNKPTDNTITSTLIGLLTDGDEADKCNAARALGKLREPDARAPLAALLRDRDIDVSVDAATALGEIGNPEDARLLIESANGDPSGEVRIAAIESLGNLGGTEAASALEHIVANRPQDLDLLEDGDWDPWWDMQLKAVRALGRIGSESSVPALVRLLEGDEGDDIESEVLNALASIGGTGEAYLIGRLEDSGSRQRRRIVRALPLCNSLDAWKALLEKLKDEHTDVRVAALDSLERLPDLAQFEGLLMVMVRDRDPGVRAVAARLLAGLEVGEAGAPEVDSALSNLLSDENPLLRESALLGLQKRSAPDAPSALAAAVRERMEDEADEVALAACRLTRDWRDVEAGAALRRLAQNPERNPALRAEALRTLATLSESTDDVVALLRQAVEDPAEPVRLAALSGLVQLDAASAASEEGDRPVSGPLALVCRIVDPLPEDEGELRDPDPGAEDEAERPAPAETAAADAQGPTSTLDSILSDNERIAEELGGSAEQDPVARMESLDDDMSEYAEFVKRTVNERDQWKSKDKAIVPADMRHLAARVLGDSDAGAAVDTLLAALADDDAELRRDAADSLARTAARRPDLPALANAWGALVTHLATDDRLVRLGCARALGALGKRKTVPVLTDALEDDDPSVRAAVIDALCRIAVKYRTDHPKRCAAAGQIRRKLEDPENHVRRSAALALLELGDEDSVKAGLGSLIRSEHTLGPAVREKLNALRSGSALEKQLKKILTGCKSSTERQPVLECIGELFKKPSNHQQRLST